MKRQNDDGQIVSQSRRLQSAWQAEKRMIRRHTINLRTEIHNDGDGERDVHHSIEEEAKSKASCRMCDAIQPVIGMAGVPGEQVPRLNAAVVNGSWSTGCDEF